MSERDTRRPNQNWISCGLMLITVGAVVLTQPRGWGAPAALLVVLGAHCIAIYADRALRWLKERP